ncbi:hypothetical protein C8J57DRAFT_1546244 [Mycena rebaudengoi]|nr:hypothetical protein C8J57DRAFT_1546244 [Mycena rebaudengoi]
MERVAEDVANVYVDEVAYVCADDVAYGAQSTSPARFPSPAARTLVSSMAAGFASSTQPTAAPNARDTPSAYDHGTAPTPRAEDTRGGQARRAQAPLAAAAHMTPSVHSPRRRGKNARNGMAAYTRVTRNDEGPHDTDRRGEAWNTAHGGATRDAQSKRHARAHKRRGPIDTKRRGAGRGGHATDAARTCAQRTS